MSITKPVSQRLQQLEDELAATKGELERRKKAWDAQLEIAARVHHSLLPRTIQHSRIDIDTRYVPRETIGGDYCQVGFSDATNCYITMCDVSGHGLGPSLLAARVSSEVKHFVMDGLRPKEIVYNLNEFIFEHFLDTELQITFFAARFDLNKKTVTYSGAGHPGPLLIRKGSRSIETLQSQNAIIGIFDQSLQHLREGNRELNRGDRLIFFTDGVPETMDSNNTMLGTDGLVDIAATTCSGTFFNLADGILERVEAFRSGSPQDDMTLIVAEIK